MMGMYFIYLHYQLEKIEVHGMPTGKQLFGLASLEKKALFMIDTKHLEKELVAQNSFVKTVNVTKQYPRDLSITVTVYYPVAYLKTQMGFFQLADDGRILAKVRQEDNTLPVITYYQNFPFQGYQAGESFSFKDIQYAMHFLKKVQLLGVKINSIDIKGLHMLGLYTEGNKEQLLFTAEKDQATQVYQLEVVVAQLRREGKEFESIDFRFEKPIIKLKK